MNLLSKAKGFWRQKQSAREIAKQLSPSFSQYGEDLLLDRLLSPGNCGLYVDVGANDPINGSNTFRLYLKGWSGLAIDPNPAFADRFKFHRPRDTYLTEGAASTARSLTYSEFAHDVFNTFDPAVVQKMFDQGMKLIRQSQVRCRPLSEIVAQHVPGRQIDLLNIDCEGLDLEVLASLDLTRTRPTVIIIEDYIRFVAFQERAEHSEVEEFLLSNRYYPVAQSAWSAIFVAQDWEELFRRSTAFDAARVQNGYLPGQRDPKSPSDTTDFAAAGQPSEWAFAP